MCKKGPETSRSNGNVPAEPPLPPSPSDTDLTVTFTNTEGEWPEEVGGIGWKARGDHRPQEKRVPFNRPTARQVYDALPFIRRYFIYWMKHTFDKEKLFINTFQPLKHKPYYGVPCGGLGSGAIGRDFRGGFCKFSLRPGLVEHKVDTIPANQFIVSVRKPGGSCLYQKVLSAADMQLGYGQLSAWDFSFPKENVYYRGLYPRSWTCYRIPELALTIVIRQISPIIPHNYEDSCMPVCVFVATVLNESANDFDVSIAFTFRNGTGNRKWNREAECTAIKFTHSDETSGVILSHSISQMPVKYTLATRRLSPAPSDSAHSSPTVSICQHFNPSKSGSGIWLHLQKTGNLPDIDDEYIDYREMAVGVCQRFRVRANSRSSEVEFALGWDMQVVNFGKATRFYKRRYTRFFADDAADALCRLALQRRKDWERAIEEWQNPVLQDPTLPEWYKSALFNETYFLTDGGSLWFEYDERWSSEEAHLSQYTREKMMKYGRFGYLESWEYRMINTYDVSFYASFALAQLWPELELCIQAEFTDQISHSIEKLIRFHMEGDLAKQKTQVFFSITISYALIITLKSNSILFGFHVFEFNCIMHAHFQSRVPHDLGNPADEPWIITNAYVMHDTGKWKDLNLKYVLTSWRDYLIVAKKDRAFLEHTWPAVKVLMYEALEMWDRDTDGMIENFGKADQTYDAWRMEGVSAYCGSLWLASLCVSAAMAEEIGDVESKGVFATNLQRARRIYIEKLWNGSYFKFCEESRSSDSIMADQLCGIWFLQSVSPKMAAEVLPPEMVSKALKTIYEYNVLKFANGQMGAVNGMKPDGTIDREYIQADEMWTGVTYALAAFFLQHGERDKAFHTASGCYYSCFERSGLQYQTPEAMYETKYYRAIGYMRPLSIWALQWVLNGKHKQSSQCSQREQSDTTTADAHSLPSLNGASTSEEEETDHNQ
ncbi:hypothetical protein WR25_08643 [Diploscapter pachys]|uniref:Non-lysosomal glucosylceramidase n=1 Tax=Diploscapter pachys TaxID=2018661 RepID=A0A2A2KV75_9BILA|nr:hypothetical protein WR25_08643 [Diploscapter pachys]